MSNAPPKDPVEKFHDHLDECKQCRENPFHLCPAGEQLLLAVQIKTPEIKE